MRSSSSAPTSSRTGSASRSGRKSRSSSRSSDAPPSRGPLVREFIETLCRPTKGEWAGRPIKLLAWQHALIDDLFTLRADGLRQFRTAYIGLPRKSGKSTLGAALALYGLVLDGEPGAEVYSVAGDRQQAAIVFQEAKAMVEAEPELKALVRVYRYHLEVPTTNSIYRVLSADAPRQQGLNPSFTVFDEVHVQKSGDLYDAMTLGSGTRRQPLIVAITTAGFDEESLAYRLYDHGKSVNDGVIEDPTFFFRWWEPSDPEADHRDPAVWYESNPSLSEGLLKLEDFEASVRSTPESAFRRFRLNQWVPAEDLWLPAGAWGACRSDRELDPRLPISVGIDLGLKHDSTAVVVCQRQRDDVVVVRSKFWQNPYPPTHPAHDQWELDIDTVLAHLRDLRKRYPADAVRVAEDIKVTGPAYVYDPWGLKFEGPKLLREERMAMLPVPQTAERMGPAARILYEHIVTGRIAHDGDPTLTAHLRNVVAVQLGDHGWRLRKPEGSVKKVDGAIALAMAVQQAQLPAPERRRAFVA